LRQHQCRLPLHQPRTTPAYQTRGDRSPFRTGTRCHWGLFGSSMSPPHPNLLTSSPRDFLHPSSLIFAPTERPASYHSNCEGGGVRISLRLPYWAGCWPPQDHVLCYIYVCNLPVINQSIKYSWPVRPSLLMKFVLHFFSKVHNKIQNIILVQITQFHALFLQGYSLCNPAIDVDIENNAHVPYAFRMGLISDELFQVLLFQT
jgi:hypothetical protein